MPSMRYALVVAMAMALSTPLSRAAGTDPVLAPPSEALPPLLGQARRELADIVARHDLDALLAHVGPDTKLSFGGDHGAEDFRRIWDSGMHDQQDLWRELDAILALPGVVQGTRDAPQYCAPYVFCLPTPGGIDPYEALVVTGTRVAIRDRPSRDGQVLTRVSHAVLQRAPDDPRDDGTTPPEWTRVRQASGTTGFIASPWVRSPIDYRLMMSVEAGSGRWMLDYFIAGD